MKKKLSATGIIIAILLPAILITGCEKAEEIPPDTFSASYMCEDGRSFGINGRSNGTPGEQLDYVLNFNNNAERWQLEYYVLLVDSDSILQEIDHASFDIAAQGGIQNPVAVTLPEDIEGAPGLCVLIPNQGCLIATLSSGSQNALCTGWPDISNYPFVNEDV